MEPNVDLPARRPQSILVRSEGRSGKVTWLLCDSFPSLISFVDWSCCGELSPVPSDSQGQRALHQSLVTTHWKGRVSGSRLINNCTNQQWCWLFSTDETDEEKSWGLDMCNHFCSTLYGPTCLSCMATEISHLQSEIHFTAGSTICSINIHIPKKSIIYYEAAVASGIKEHITLLYNGDINTINIIITLKPIMITLPAKM